MVESNKQKVLQAINDTQRNLAPLLGKGNGHAVQPQSSEYRVEHLVVDPFTGLPIPTAGDIVRPIAKATIWTGEQHQELLKKYPNLDKLMPVIRVGTVTCTAAVSGFMVGGPAGALAFGTTAFISAARAEIIALAISHAAGKEMGAAFGLAVEKLSPMVKGLDQTITDTDATAFATGVLMTGLIASDVKGFGSQIKAAGHGAKVNSSVLYKDTVDITKPDFNKDYGLSKETVTTKPITGSKLKDQSSIKDAPSGVKPTKLDGPIKPIYGDKTVKIGEHEFPVIPVSSMEKLGKPTKQGPLYQEKIAELYKAETPLPNKYGTEINGVRKGGVADSAFLNKEFKRIAVEAKYIDKWDKSHYNPNYIKDKPFLINDKTDVLAQARKYQNSTFHEVVYHTNSPEFVAFYKDLFDKEGFTKMKFVISPKDEICY